MRHASRPGASLLLKTEQRSAGELSAEDSTQMGSDYGWGARFETVTRRETERMWARREGSGRNLPLVRLAEECDNLLYGRRTTAKPLPEVKRASWLGRTAALLAQRRGPPDRVYNRVELGHERKCQA